MSTPPADPSAERDRDAVGTPDDVPPDDVPPGDVRPDEGAGDDAPPDAPTFGPSGYLPGRAAARARKIVLRAPLGLQWMVGALVAGVAVLVAGIAWWASSGPPEAPFVATVAVADAGPAVELDDLDVLLVTAGGTAAAFSDVDEFELAWCSDSRRIEGTVDGEPASWQAGTGRGFGVPSLARHPVLVHDGTVYVDPTREVAGPRPADAPEPPTC